MRRDQYRTCHPSRRQPLDGSVDVALSDSLTGLVGELEVDVDAVAVADETVVSIVEVGPDTNLGATCDGSKDGADSHDCNQENCNCLFHNSSIAKEAAGG